MKRLTLIISEEAVADLVDLWTFIAEDSPERADQFVDAGLLAKGNLQVAVAAQHPDDLQALLEKMR